MHTPMTKLYFSEFKLIPAQSICFQTTSDISAHLLCQTA